jgi:hypothetical protein
MFIWTFFFLISRNIISQSIADSSWITLYRSCVSWCGVVWKHALVSGNAHSIKQKVSNPSIKVQVKCTHHEGHIGGAELYLYPFLTSAIEGIKWWTSCSGHFTLGKRPGTQWIKDLMGCIASRDIVEKRKISCPARIWTPGCPAHSLVIILTALYWLPSVAHGSSKLLNPDPCHRQWVWGML